jgi:sugar lactone lactonase YvrE
MSRVENVWRVGATLGEGPVWTDGALWFVDIKQKKVHRCDADGADRRSWDSPEQIGFLLPADGGGFVAGLRRGLHLFDPETGAFERIVEVEPDLPGNRLNDGVVDPAGRLWFGTMDNGEAAPTGSFYSYHRGTLRHSGISGVPITNGPAISPDGRILYWIDTLARTLHAADIAADGSLGPSRLLLTIPEGEGNPDGPTVDSEGCIWISLYWGWAAKRYSPAGALLETIRFTVPNITKLAFGGADLRTAFATTARHGIAPEDLAKWPEAGALFVFEVEAPGFPCPRAQL